MVITNESMREYVLANPKLVKKKDLGNGLYLLKYTNKVFYDDLWDEHNKECRGTIVDENFNLVQYPFTKIFNYGIEKQAPVLPDGTNVKAFKKFNGFMVAATWHDGEVLVSTTGSVDSKYAELGRSWLSLLDIETIVQHPEHTFMFECVDKSDPHIIPEVEGMYFLANRKKEWGSRVNPTYNTHQISRTLGDLKSIVKDCKHEGYVFYTEDGICSKFKSPYYLVKKLFARGNTDKLLARDIKRAIDEEYYPLVDHIRENKEEFKNLDEQARLALIRSFLEDTCVLG